jgi:hypothetical protein
VAIYRLLQRSAFGPEETKRMSEAYERALVMLELKDRDDPLTETIAKLIVEAAQKGVNDPESICTIALRWLREPDQQAS